MIEGYWSWLLARSGRRVGYRLLLNRWLGLDALVAVVLTFGLRVDGFEFASKALIPSASILAGMSFAWTTRASSILNNVKFRSNIIDDDNPLEDYVYGFQLSIMILFICVIYIAIMSVGGFSWFLFDRDFSVLVSTFFLFAIISMTVRECWSVVNFTNLLTILEDKVNDGRQK